MNTSPETSWQRDCTEHFNQALREHLSGVAIQAAMDCPDPSRSQTAVELAIDDAIVDLWATHQQGERIAQSNRRQGAVRPKPRVVMRYKIPVGDND